MHRFCVSAQRGPSPPIGGKAACWTQSLGGQGFATHQPSRQSNANWREPRPIGEFVAKPWRGSILALVGTSEGSRLSRTAPDAVRNREKPCARGSPESWPTNSTSSDPRHKRLHNSRLRLQSSVPTPLAIELGTQSGGAGGCLRVCVVAQSKPFCSTGITRGGDWHLGPDARVRGRATKKMDAAACSRPI